LRDPHRHAKKHILSDKAVFILQGMEAVGLLSKMDVRILTIKATPFASPRVFE